MVYIDTWAWYALVDATNSKHFVAKKFSQTLAEQNSSLFTSNFVVAETVNLIRYKLGLSRTLMFRDRLQDFISSGFLQVVRVDIAIEKSAWQILEYYTDQDFSFTDCTSFAIMRQFKIDMAFTQDHHFRVMGFVTMPV